MAKAANPFVQPVINAADWATKKSRIRKDMEEVMDIDQTKLSTEDKLKYARKYAQLIDILPFDPVSGTIADAVAFEATKYDIDEADVTFWRKAAAKGANYFGLGGALTGIGPFIDMAAYETISRLIEEDN